MVTKHFGTAADGSNIPNTGAVSATVMGKNVDPSALIAALASGGAITPVNILVQSGAVQVTEVVPGGRKLDELSQSQVEGKTPYKPADLFGAGPG